MIATVDIIIYKTVKVEIAESKFDDDFIASFKKTFYDIENIQGHIENLAQMKARGLINNYSPDPDGVFIEGYGREKEMGIKLVETSEEWDVE